MTAVEHAVSSADRYRSERAPCNQELGRQLERITGDIEDPVAKLRYLRGAIERCDEVRIGRLPYGPVRRALYRLRGLEALGKVIAEDSEASAGVAQRTVIAHKRARKIVLAALAAGLLFVPALLAGLALQIEPTSSPRSAAASNVSAASAGAGTQAPRADKPAPVEPLAESLPADVLGIVPTTIWLADRGPGWELYSNGLRIETTYAVAGERRRYRVHRRDTGLAPEVHSEPVGILFHTSESDLWPLEPGFEGQLRRSSRGLLRYVRGVHAYNYLIDRFGRVYRIVADGSRANHAGHSVWARNDEVYLDLNAAFLGVSFESRWDGGRALPITRAQLIAGRNLTHYLRQRFAIAPDMCVTHGLTSVSPKQGLIGYHRDWARGFPFEAFGLPDLYAQPLPSVLLFGFGHDDEFLRAVGQGWPGLLAAQRLLTEEARERLMPLSSLLRERQALYREWSKQAPAAESAERNGEVQQAADKRG